MHRLISKTKNLKKYRHEFEKNGFCLIKGDVIYDSLINFGADPDCLHKFKSGEIHEQVPVDLDPAQSYAIFFISCKFVIDCVMIK